GPCATPFRCVPGERPVAGYPTTVTGCPPIAPVDILTRSGGYGDYLNKETAMDTRTRKPYPTDLTDAQWARLEPRILAYEDRVRPGPVRAVDLREVVNTLLYLNRTGCQWALLPHDLLPKSTVYDYFTKWRDHGVFQMINAGLREAVRESTPQVANPELMREPTPSAACVDSQTVK